MQGCASCGGVFLDSASSQLIASTFNQEAMRLADSISQVAQSQPDLRVQGIPCPACMRPMSPFRVQAAQVDVDCCAQHGTWFDRNELQQIARAMAQARQQAFRQNAANVAVPVAAGAGVAMAAQPYVQHVSPGAGGAALETAADVALDVAPVALDVGLSVGGAIADAGGAEVAGGLLEGALGLVGAIFEGITS